MKLDKILLTGGSGNLGRAILKSGLFLNILAPSRNEMDITDKKGVEFFFEENNPDVVIHCAAVVKMTESEQDPAKTIDVNIVGTCNLVKQAIRAEKKNGKSIRFIYISTDGVYSSIKGNYSEKDSVLPYNQYGWSKLGGECAVNLLSNFCIIRTSFFNPEMIKYERYATDKYSSRVPIDYLLKAIAFLLDNNFVGTVNIGGKRESDFNTYKKIKPNIKPCLREDILKNSSIAISSDASLDSSLWRELTKEIKDFNLNE